ncbi:MAG: hypothetical protein ACYDEY_07805 [Acidimicrobiales bacterium]
MPYGGFITHPARTHDHIPSRPDAASDPASGSRTGGAASGGWWEGAMESAGLVLADEAFQGWCPHMAGSSRTPLTPTTASRRSARSGQRIANRPSRPSRSIRPADRGPAVRCGVRGKGRGESWARAR